MLDPADVREGQRDGAEPAPATPDVAPRPTQNWSALLLEHRRLVAAGLMLAIGIVLTVLGWYGAAYTNIITEQIPYLISGGLLGLGFIIVAGTLASSAMQQRDNDELRKDLTRAIRALQAAGGAGRNGTTAAPSSNGHHVFVLPGGRSFHEAGCPIIEGKAEVEELVGVGAAVSAGYAPCKLCDVTD